MADLSKHIKAELARADRVALAARSAAQAGDHRLADLLRAQMDAIYDALEKQSAGGQNLANGEAGMLARSGMRK